MINRPPFQVGFTTMGALMFLVAFMLTACTVSHREETVPSSSSDAVSITVDSIEPDFDPVKQLEEARHLRNQLTKSGVECSGEAMPLRASPGGYKTGAVAALNCVNGDATIEITIYRSEDAKEAGLRKLRFIACAAGGRIEYVDGDVWTVAAIMLGKNESDPALTAELGRVLESPIAEFDC